MAFNEDTAGPDAPRHEPVMLQEVLDFLDPQPGETIVDGTLGGGGHAQAICERLGPTGRLIGIEQDADALALARRRLSGCRVTLVRDNFRNLEKILSKLAVDGVDGILLDLGLSSFQLETAERGFSFRWDAPLDMRMDMRMPTTAADLVNRMREDELVRLFLASGYGRMARRLAKVIVNSRQQSPITTTGQLVALITTVIPVTHRSKIHPATQAFQALRIAVNDELVALAEVLPVAARYSNFHARIVVLSYHSLEDREVKHQFRFLAGKRPPSPDKYSFPEPAEVAQFRVLTPKPLCPSMDEVRRNPRSRSAKLRAVERIIDDR